MSYQDGLSNRSSKVFIEKATMIEHELLPVIQEDIQNILSVKVVGFQSGSVVVKFHIIMNETASIPSNIISMINKATTDAAKSKRFTFTVDASFHPKAGRKCLYVFT